VLRASAAASLRLWLWVVGFWQVASTRSLSSAADGVKRARLLSAAGWWLALATVLPGAAAVAAAAACCLARHAQCHRTRLQARVVAVDHADGADRGCDQHQHLQHRLLDASEKRLLPKATG